MTLTVIVGEHTRSLRDNTPRSRPLKPPEEPRSVRWTVELYLREVKGMVWAGDEGRGA